MTDGVTITRKSASNLALAFVLLPRHRRRAMTSLYAFCRQVDDAADEESLSLPERQAHLDAWREDIRKAFTPERPRFAVNQEIQDLLTRYPLRLELFEELIQGVEMDLRQARYETHQELDLYCYRVASVVGLLSIEIFGYRNPRTRDYAVALGKALQLTNILRDVRTDAEKGRIYLPQEALRAHQVDPEEILRFRYSDRFFRLAQSVAERAASFYRQARELLPPEDAPAMRTAELMGAVYWRLLKKLEASRFQVFEAAPARLSAWRKAALVARFLISSRAPSLPAYGIS